MTKKPPWFGNPSHLPVQRSKIREMFVRQRLHAEVVRRGRQACLRDVGNPKSPVGARASRDGEHFRRDIDAIDGGVGAMPL